MSITTPQTLLFETLTDVSTWSPVGTCTLPMGTSRLGLEVQRIGSGADLITHFEALEVCRG